MYGIQTAEKLPNHATTSKENVRDVPNQIKILPVLKKQKQKTI
jgi:hypothetical protein